MNEHLPGIIISTIIAVLFFISTAFLALTNTTITIFNSLDPSILINLIFNTNFLLFLITLSTGISMILLTAKMYNYKFATIFSITGIFFGTIVGFIVFNQLNYLLILIIAIIGVVISIKNLTKKEEELKYLKILRSGSSTAGKIILFLAIAIFLQLVIINSANQKELEENFTSNILNMTLGDSKSLNDSINAPLVDLVILTQQQTIHSILQNPTYKKLETKNDTDTQTFIATMNALNTQMNSKEYKQLYQTQINDNSKTINLQEGIIKNSPMLELLSKNAWIVYAISGLITALFVGGLIVKNLSGIIYVLIVSLINFVKEEQKREE